MASEIEDHLSIACNLSEEPQVQRATTDAEDHIHTQEASPALLLAKSAKFVIGFARVCRTKQDQHHETSKRHPACEQGRFRATGNGCVQIWKNTVLRDDDEFSFALSSNTDKKLPIAKLTIEGMELS